MSKNKEIIYIRKQILKQIVNLTNEECPSRIKEFTEKIDAILEDNILMTDEKDDIKIEVHERHLSKTARIHLINHATKIALAKANRDNFQEELAPVFNDMGGGPIPDFSSGTTAPPNDMPIYNSMMQDVRGDLVNSYKRGNQSQAWNIGEYNG